jgi:hypothetical protein
MVTEIFSDIGVVHYDVNTNFLQEGAGADARKLKDLRGVDDSTTYENFFTSFHKVFGAASSKCHSGSCGISRAALLKRDTANKSLG